MIDAQLFKFVLFETVLVIENPKSDTIIKPVSYHPLFVGPRDINYTDQSRTNVQKTLKTTHSNKAGRQPLQCWIGGTFGKMPRLTHGGLVDGMTRLKQFWDEIVRLGDSIDKNEVGELLSMLSINLPFWKVAAGLPASFNESSMWFEVNFYDFRNSRRFRCNIDQFQLNDSWTKNNLPDYSIQLTELGPILTPKFFVDKALDAMFRADEFAGDVLGRIMTIQLNQWANMLEQGIFSVKQNISNIKSKIGGFFTVGTKRDMQIALDGGDYTSAPTANGYARNVERARLLSESTNALLGQPEKIISLQTINRQLNELYDLSDQVYDSLKDQAILINAAVNELSDTPADDPVDYDAFIYNTLRAQEDYAHLRTIHKYFAMNVEEYSKRLGGSGSTGANARHSIPHTIGESESIIDIAEQYGLSPAVILDYNGIDPDDIESLESIEIPIESNALIPGIDGLPVFDSHKGKSALGRDIDDAGQADEDGDLLVLGYDDTIRQNVSHAIADFTDEALENIDTIPDYLQGDYLEIKLRETLKQDPRIVHISNLNITADQSSFALELTAETVSRGKINVKG